MLSIAYYTETLRDLEVAKLRLQFLLDKKEELSVKLLGIHSPSYGEENIHGGGNKDKVLAYLEALEQRLQPNGLTLKEDIERATDNVKKLEIILDKMREILKDNDTIEGRLYYHVVVGGMSKTKAVEKVSEECYISEVSIWKNYYPRIKKEIEKAIKSIVKV